MGFYGADDKNVYGIIIAGEVVRRNSWKKHSIGYNPR